MKRTIVMIIEDNNEKSLEVKPFPNESCNIFVAASDEGEALDLLSQGLKKANETDFEAPSEDEEKELSPSKWELFIEDYKKTPGGARFIKSLDNAVKFYCKNIVNDDVRGIDVQYIAAKHNNNMWEAITDIGALYYWHGYNLAKKEMKNK